jgi:Predicted nucleoside-diphosphate-sugar epimerases
MYVIVGSTGHIGSVVARKLLEHGKKVRVIARDASRMQTLTELGAEAMAGSLFDTDFLYHAFQGSTAVFTIIPGDIRADDMMRHMDTIGGSISTALRMSHASHVVNISSIGAENIEGTGPIAGLHRQEERLNQMEDCNVLHLRPSYFMENFLNNIPVIKYMGINGSPIRGDLQIAMNATRDIGAAAAERLLSLDFKDKSFFDLMGPQDLTMNEATKILGAAIGKPDLSYVQFSFEDAENGMIQAGISPNVASNYNEMAKALNEGLVHPAPRTPENTTHTSLEEFAHSVFAPAFG